jgi:hypothetical protein
MRYAFTLSSFLLLCLLTLASAASAQVNTADITGTVLDQAGGAVAGANVLVRNVATGLERRTITGDTGDYLVALLPPGDYEVKVEAQGFSTVLQKVSLVVGRRATLNFSLKPGAVTEVITIEGGAPLVETTKSEIYGSVTPLEVKELPILDRNFASLTYLVPGVRPAQGFDPTKSRVGNMSLNGGDGRQFDINVDGADNKDNVVGGVVQNFTLEGIQEFNVITNRYTAESGRTVGGIVNVVTKSGTNEIHGSLFGLFQSSTFNKKSFFDRDVGNDGIIGTADDKSLPKPVFHRYHFGGSVGAPIFKDKLFAFGAYEHKREPGSISADPTTFRELSLFPLASAVGQLPVPYKDHLLTIKVDHMISDKQNMAYRYGRQRWVNPNDQLGNPFVADLSQTQSNTNQFHDFVIQHNYTVAANKVNSIVAHFQDFVNEILAAPAREFTLPVAGGGAAVNPNIIFPSGAEVGTNVNVPQQTLIRKYQIRDDFAWTHNRHNMKFGINYIYLAKFGGFFFFGANGYQIFFWDDPSTIVSDRTRYPQGFATPGAVREIDFNGGDGRFRQPLPHQLAFYFQDDFKITPRLTLNLGLRWDANIRFLPPQRGDSPTTTNRTIGVFQQVVAANPTAPGAQEGLARMRALVSNPDDLRRTTPSWKEFQPRLGFAWDPTGTGKHVIRGGYGIAFDQVFQNLTLFAAQQANQTIYQTIFALTNSTPPPNPTGQLATFRFGMDPLPAPRAGITDLEPGAFGRINDPKIRDPYAQQWSLGWVWEFLPDYAFSVDYYHVLAIAEPRVQNINPRIRPVCDPNFPGSNPSDARCVRGATTRFFDAAFQAAGLGAGRLEQSNMIGTTNRSVFDSLNFVLRKRFSRSFLLQTHYILSNSRSWGGRPTSSYSGNGIAITPENQFKDGEFGPSIFDERHRFVVSGHFQLPYGFEISPVFQAASARPFRFRSGQDTDGDGRNTVDRVCVGSTISNRLIPGRNAPFGCEQVKINSLRGDRFAQLDTRFGYAIKFGERMSLRLYYEIYNLFDTNNFGNNFQENATAANFNQPLGYFGGQGFGPANSGPLRSQFGFRFEF